MYHNMVLFHFFFGALARSGEHCNRCSGAAVMNLDQLCIEQYHAPRIYFEKNVCVCPGKVPQHFCTILGTILAERTAGLPGAIAAQFHSVADAASRDLAHGALSRRVSGSGAFILRTIFGPHFVSLFLS